MEVTLTQPYVCQIHSQRHTEMKALERGYLEAIPVIEGQAVKENEVLFRVKPILYEAKLAAEIAEMKYAEKELEFSQNLSVKGTVAKSDVALHTAKLAKAKANVELATAELGFTNVKAPFDGIIDRLLRQQGSLVEEGDVLTTISDNSVMWVYFNVPEKNYLQYKADQDQHKADPKIELILANHKKFDHLSTKLTIEADFNNTNGNIAFRADFPNPDRLLRHGQTGTVLIKRELPDALVIPQRSTYEILEKKYVFVIDKDNIAHQREITIQHELDDIYVIEKGLSVDDRIVLEGTRQVRDGDEVEYEDKKPEEVLAQLKNKAE
jgi:membrane fusion protein (multidrug efflux system)